MDVSLWKAYTDTAVFDWYITLHEKDRYVHIYSRTRLYIPYRRKIGTYTDTVVLDCTPPYRRRIDMQYAHRYNCTRQYITI